MFLQNIIIKWKKYNDHKQEMPGFDWWLRNWHSVQNWGGRLDRWTQPNTAIIHKNGDTCVFVLILTGRGRGWGSGSGVGGVHLEVGTCSSEQFLLNACCCFFVCLFFKCPLLHHSSLQLYKQKVFSEDRTHEKEDGGNMSPRAATNTHAPPTRTQATFPIFITTRFKFATRNKKKPLTKRVDAREHWYTRWFLRQYCSSTGLVLLMQGAASTLRLSLRSPSVCLAPWKSLLHSDSRHSDRRLMKIFPSNIL